MINYISIDGIIMIRTFHSIGQGAFYTEEFDDFRFVYDCGTDTDGKKGSKNI